MRINEAVRHELEAIRSRHKGMLKPSDVVKAARKKDSALHKRFCWDDTVAARRYRLWQARELIAVAVERFSSDHSPVRVYVSLGSDRKKGGGGYRHISDVMSNASLRERLLGEALQELRRWEERYTLLRDLAPIIRAANRLRARRRKTSSSAAAD